MRRKKTADNTLNKNKNKNKSNVRICFSKNQFGGVENHRQSKICDLDERSQATSALAIIADTKLQNAADAVKCHEESLLPLQVHIKNFNKILNQNIPRTTFVSSKSLSRSGLRTEIILGVSLASSWAETELSGPVKSTKRRRRWDSKPELAAEVGRDV